jgi:hypothetical protein
MVDFLARSETTFVYNENITIHFDNEHTGIVFQKLLDNQELFSTVGDLVAETRLDKSYIESALNEIDERIKDLSLEIEVSSHSNAFRLVEREAKPEPFEVSKNNERPSKHNAHRLRSNKPFRRIGYRHVGKTFTMNNGIEIEFDLMSQAILFDQIQMFGQTNIPMIELFEKYNKNRGKSRDLNDPLALKNMISGLNNTLKAHGINYLRIACFLRDWLVVIERTNELEA